MTFLWNENGERVSRFKVENSKVWMILEKGGMTKELHVFKTERVFYSKLAETIRRRASIEAYTLISERDRFLLGQVPWEEIAIRAIRERL